jgi:predicted dehydrogenase
MGVVGCADIARRRMLPAMAAHPGIELVAVASRDADRAAETARTFGCRPVSGYAALLGRSDLDAVYLPLPVALHAEWTEAALRAGRHVLVEKPLTPDPDRAAELCDLARQRGLVLAENVLFVHHRQHAVVRDLVQRGEIGELRALRAAFSIPALPEGNIRYRADLGGGALWDVGLYPVRLALHLLGPDLEVLGAARAAGPGKEVDTSGAALLRTPAGVVAHLDWGLDHAYRSVYELVGSTGRILVDRAFTPPADHRPTIQVERGGTTQVRRSAPDDQVTNALDAFVASIRGGSPAADDTPLAQIRLLDDIRRAARLPVPLST